MEHPDIDILQNIHKKFRKTIWRPFIKGVKQYELVKEGDKIAVCISGGKDSMLLAKLMQALHSYSEVPFALEFIVMNPGYKPADLDKIISNASLLEIPISVFESDIFDVIQKVDGSPCYLCARMRRGHLYSYAQKLGCNKIALGHHLSDVVETTLMGMLFGSQYQVMMPKLKSTNFQGMELIRPLCCVTEDAIIKWQKHSNFTFMACGCPLTESSCGMGGRTSKRTEVKSILRNLKASGNKDVEKSIFNGLHTINLNQTISYKLDGKMHNFLDIWDTTSC